MNIRRKDEHGFIEIDMKDYISKIYERFNKPRIRNIPYRQKTIKSMKAGSEQLRAMRELTGALLFVAKVRTDIKFITPFFCSYNDKFNKSMIDEAKRIIGYLKGTENLILKIEPKNMILEAAFDSDFAGCRESKIKKWAHMEIRRILLNGKIQEATKEYEQFNLC